VLIVGTGPAGATLAFLLARRGIEVELVERHSDFAREFRGEGVMPSGASVFQQMGLGPALDALPQTRIGALEIYLGPRRIGGAAFTPEQMGILGPRVIPQPAMLEMLVAEASRFPSFTLHRGVTVRDLVREGGRVAGVRCDFGGEERELRADLAIGTDGRSSVLRRRAGFAEIRFPQQYDVVWGKVPLPDFPNARSTARAYLGRGHAALVFPAPDDRLQIGWIIDKGLFGDLRRQGIERWIEQMADHLSPDLAGHLRASAGAITHPFLLDVACDRTERWSEPGLLLLGDAAHTMSPVGAQGINLALRDAVVAANHLGPLLSAAAPPAAIDEAARRIEKERLPEIVAIQRLQQIPPRALFTRSRWRQALFATLFPLLVRSGIAGLAFARVFTRFARGITEVRLEER
jgi:2-polyprenyl-6-methoxyphenol hydroxylase-like FAD-dependent oxidoreductase